MLTPTATANAWRLFSLRQNDPEFALFHQRVMQRDQHICQYCRFSAKKDMVVVNKDGDYLNNRLSNMLLACPLCAQCGFIDALSTHEHWGGVLIHCPELTQIQLNALCHVLFAALVSNSSNKGQANEYYRSLRLRAQPVEALLGKELSQPAVLGKMLLDGDLQSVQSFSDQLWGEVRLLPLFNRFSFQVACWQMEALTLLTGSCHEVV